MKKFRDMKLVGSNLTPTEVSQRKKVLAKKRDRFPVPKVVKCPDDYKPHISNITAMPDVHTLEFVKRLKKVLTKTKVKCSECKKSYLYTWIGTVAICPHCMWTSEKPFKAFRLKDLKKVIKNGK